MLLQNCSICYWVIKLTFRKNYLQLFIFMNIGEYKDVFLSSLEDTLSSHFYLFCSFLKIYHSGNFPSDYKPVVSRLLIYRERFLQSWKMIKCNFFRYRFLFFWSSVANIYCSGGVTNSILIYFLYSLRFLDITLCYADVWNQEA